jgi:hypothetical protein
VGEPHPNYDEIVNVFQILANVVLGDIVVTVTDYEISRRAIGDLASQVV